MKRIIVLMIGLGWALSVSAYAADTKADRGVRKSKESMQKSKEKPKIQKEQVKAQAGTPERSQQKK